MSIRDFQPSAGTRWPVIRPLRLGTGLILFAYATSHFINHAFGLLSVEAMEAASIVLLKPWQTAVGLTALYGSFLIHAALGLRALYRRRHLHMPASEAWQLALGLAIPLLLIPHAAGVRIGISAYGMEYGYPSIINRYWVVSPDFALPRQFLLLVVLWLHACIGLRAWLRTKVWYPRAVPTLASLATLVPILAILGFSHAGAELREALQRDPTLAATFAAPAPDSQAALNAAARDRLVDMLSFVYLGLVTSTFALRALRNWHARHFRAVRIAYPGARAVTVPAGFSVLEASRWAGIPHASVCGGRGRCSTCRVRVFEGAELLPPLNAVECKTLLRIGAPANVRLACQLRPTADIAVEPLVPADANAPLHAHRFEPAIEGGRELTIAALFVDLRDSTGLASGRLPYDALFLADRYVQAVTQAIRNHAGEVTSIAGDGVMSVFGVDGDARKAAANAFKAAHHVWRALDQLNASLADELETPLRFGLGLHVGEAVVGWRHGVDSRSLQFLGDTGNVAAKLEAETKRHGCTLIASMAAINSIVGDTGGLTTVSIRLAGKEEPVTAAQFRTDDELDRIVHT
jgi:adenylate cyclase